MKWLNKLSYYKKTISFILGTFSVLSLPPYYLFFVAIICFSGLFYLLTTSKNLKTSFALGYWFGVGHFALGFSWASNALLVDFNAFGWLYPISILASGAFFGLFSGFATIFTCKFKSIFSKLLAFASFWTISEWLRSFVLTGFPWNLLGSILTFTPELYQSASIFGTYGLSLITILFCGSPVLFTSDHKPTKTLAILLILFIPITNYVYGYFRLQKLTDKFTQQGINVRLIQPSIAQNLKWNKETLEQNFAKHIELSQQKGLENIDIVIWGETASPFALDIDHYHRQQLLQAIPEHGYLITGVVRVQTSPYGHVIPYNSMLIFNKRGDIVDYYDKSHLVPFGEYIPLRQYLPSWIKPITNTIANFQAGNGPRSINIPNIPSFGALICYEIIFPSEITNKQNRPQWLINITNDAWYGDSAGPRQHFISTVLRAVEEGLTIVRVANNGISGAITPLGQILANMPLNHVGFLDIKLPQQLSTPTLYGQQGNLIPLGLSIILILLGLILSHNYNKHIK